MLSYDRLLPIAKCLLVAWLFEHELENGKQMFQFWSADYQKHHDLHLKHMLDVYTKGCWIVYTVADMIEDIMKATVEIDVRCIYNYYFEIVPDIIKARTIKEDFSIHPDYHINLLTMKDFELVIENLRIQFGQAIYRPYFLKISLLFGLFYGVFTKGSNKLVGWISTTYTGENGSWYVDPKHRRNGLGHSLLDFIGRKANEHNIFTSSYVMYPRKGEILNSYISFSSVFGSKLKISSMMA